MKTSLLALMLMAGCPSCPKPAPASGLTVLNRCEKQLWVAQHGFSAAAATPLAPGKSLTFSSPPEGLASTRVWAKLGCDDTGQNCAIGQSDAPCPPQGCAPPVDSKVEATWACTLADAGGCAVNPSKPDSGLGSTTWWNASAVDGYTLPFTVTASTADAGCPAADCSALSLSLCPSDLIPRCNGTATSASLLARASPDSGVAGCFSPCMAIGYPTYGGEGCSPANGGGVQAPFCCPTPPISPATCSAGPAAQSGYVALIHSACNRTVYGYAYDDATGLRQCQGSTHLTVTFGPGCP